jgi:hypothetical protein
MELNQVHLEHYPKLTEIPAGFKIVGEHKTRRGPSPMGHNWYSRWESAQFLIFQLLGLAPTNKPEGYTVDELKALFDNEADKAEVDKIISRFGGSWDHRHTGFDLVVNDQAQPPRYMLIWRDPRVHYAKEIGLEGDFSQTPYQKTPTYVEKVPQAIAQASQPKAEAAPKQPKAPKAPKAEGTTKAKKDQATSAPEGGYLAAFGNVQATRPDVQGGTVAEIVNNAIGQFVKADAVMTDENVKVVDRLRQVIDQNGLEGPTFVEFVAKYQKEGAILPGFYKICKDLAKVYAASKTAPAAQAQAQPATEQPVA